MKCTGRQLLKKLNVLLAVLLCCVFTVAIPGTLQAAPSVETAQQEESIGLVAKNPLALIAGEVSSGDPEGILLLDRTLLSPVLMGLLRNLYPQEADTAPAPRSYPASKGDCGLHTILTKGP